MTPEERFALHEQWLQNHDRVMAEHDQAITKHTLAIADHNVAMAQHMLAMAEIREAQRKQSAVLLELTQHVVRLLERWDQADNGDGPQP